MASLKIVGQQQDWTQTDIMIWHCKQSLCVKTASQRKHNNFSSTLLFYHLGLDICNCSELQNLRCCNEHVWL